MFEVTGIGELPAGKPLNDLGKSELETLQRALGASCYDAGPVDGLIGSRTRTAYADLIDDLGEGDPALIHAPACAHLEDRASQLGDLLNKSSSTAEQVKARLEEACIFAGLGAREQIAYVLATTEHETNHTFQPVREAYWVTNAEQWRKKHLSYYPYYGRGYVQLTWERNYKQYGDVVGLDLIADPDAALRHDVALFVIVQGMKIGAFTGRKLEDYVRPGHVDFVKARKVINGLDRAQDIAALAQSYL